MELALEWHNQVGLYGVHMDLYCGEWDEIVQPEFPHSPPFGEVRGRSVDVDVNQWNVDGMAWNTWIPMPFHGFIFGVEWFRLVSFSHHAIRAIHITPSSNTWHKLHPPESGGVVSILPNQAQRLFKVVRGNCEQCPIAESPIPVERQLGIMYTPSARTWKGKLLSF